MYILGLSTMTESSAVLLREGSIVAAVEQERFSRIKHDGGFPVDAIKFVLDAEGIALKEVDHIAIYWNRFQLGHRLKYVAGTLIKNPRQFAIKVKRSFSVWGGDSGNESGWSSLFKLQALFQQHFGTKVPNVHFLDHHECHMASCFLASGFEESAILIMDGAGEAACTTWGMGRGHEMKKIAEHLIPHSLGHFYSAITGYLGFKMLDGEYKVMGLSPYGDPSGAKWIQENFLQMKERGRYQLNTGALDYHAALMGDFRGTFSGYFGQPRERNNSAEFNDRHRDIAASAQRAYEEVVLHMARELQRLTGLKKLAIAGGCGLNCVANGTILATGVFEELYVPPVPNDAGGSLGAAYLLYVQLTRKRPDPVTHAQFGPHFQNSRVDNALQGFPNLLGEKLQDSEIPQKAAQALSQGKLLAWMQGPMEFGPRALGNRSFLADPRSDAIRDRMNEKIKKRELFRPFAPSVKNEKASEYFDIEQSSPFMNIVVPVKPEKRSTIPAVTHVDGSARPQTVSKDVNERYWRLIDEFEKITGVPVILNTSFNIQEPIVCSPEEALGTFSASKVDALVIENYWVTQVL